ncbi:hypothetical protein E2L06_19595 [Haloterrigena sp. H1]|uniref:ribonuclease H-like domain-containing protein n=1 Tax=Haloterrigena sp. H1 TaxID=2552943 RepID=UPI00110EBA61|nr:ribonuclease H-like domain-containing protein [Haloterrigena sp. H1]TMT79040.1 hypothetical protein E2L06_19595 [Haloterrigena sp. H1]
MQYDRDGFGYDQITTLDIETTHWKAAEGETVSVGVAVHDRDGGDLSYEPFHRTGDDEADVITRALDYVSDCGADALVSYNGRDFDLEFLTDRLYRLGAENAVSQAALDPHINLLADRKAVCDRTGEKWPSLEECLAAYVFDEPVTKWNGHSVTNERFGEELGPAYLEAVTSGDEERLKRSGR